MVLSFEFDVAHAFLGIKFKFSIKLICRRHNMCSRTTLKYTANRQPSTASHTNIHSCQAIIISNENSIKTHSFAHINLDLNSFIMMRSFDYLLFLCSVEVEIFLLSVVHFYLLCKNKSQVDTNGWLRTV